MSEGEAAGAIERLETLLRDAPAGGVDAAALLPGAIDGATAELVLSILSWEAGLSAAAAAAARLAGVFVDANEMRVALPDELADTLAMRDAHAPERSAMLGRTLRRVFEAEDTVSIDRPVRGGATSARAFLEGLGVLEPFVIDRLCLLRTGEHSLPLDGRLHALLRERGIVGQGQPGDASRQLASQCPPGRAKELYQRLESWADTLASAGR